jgi:DNA-binding beta-propeller fold protein YncE
MRTNLSKFYLFWTLLFLSGCGGGGGGSSSSSSTYTASPSVFINSSTISNVVSLGYLRQMFFDGTYLYVVNSADVDQTTSSGGKIYKFDTSGAYVSSIGTSIKWPFSVSVFSGDVFAVATDTVGGNSGLINLSSSPTPVVTALSSPYGVGIDSTNSRVFISDVGSGTYADGVVIYNIGSYTSVVASVTIGSKPSGFAYDSSLGYMFVTRYSGGTAGVWKISTTSPYTASAFATSSLFNNPIGIAVRSSYKEVYVANTGTTAGDTDSSILKITYDSSGNATAVTTFLSGTSTSSMLCGPVGLAINGNVLYISNGTCTTNSAYAKSVIKVTLDS